MTKCELGQHVRIANEVINHQRMNGADVTLKDYGEDILMTMHAVPVLVAEIRRLRADMALVCNQNFRRNVGLIPKKEAKP